MAERLLITPCDIDHAHQVYRRWLGDQYDLQVLDAVLAVAATNKLDGDPPWLLVVGGSGAAKTETVMPLDAAGAHIVSTISSDAALLSGTPKPDHAKDATGGLLRKIGDRGMLVIKDFTSIISMNKDLRATVLAALREIHDGHWQRDVGAEGGRTLHWSGRVVLVGAVTTAYDRAHGVIATMGDRFSLIRQDSTAGKSRTAAGHQALANIGHETQMRDELADATAGVLAGARPALATLTDTDRAILLELADVVTLARTAVHHDYQGRVTDSEAPEMPTRFAKFLGQIMRGALSIGMGRQAAGATAVRVAGDTVPPLRLAVLADVTEYPDSTCSTVTARVQKPRSTVDRILQELHILGLLTVASGGSGSGWTYRLAEAIEAQTVQTLVTRKVSQYPWTLQGERLGTDKPGDDRESLGVDPPTYTPPRNSATALADLLAGLAPANCPDCGWPPDSGGHAANCLKVAA